MTISRTQSQATSKRSTFLPVSVFAASLMFLIGVLIPGTSNMIAAAESSHGHDEFLFEERVLFADVEDTSSPAIFLLDERHGIAGVTYGSAEAVAEAQQLREKKPPLKASFRRVTAVILEILDHNTISIQTHEGHAQSLEVRPLVLDKLTKLPKGNLVVLFLDDENTVTDASIYDTEY